jgi:hypothetical protein
MARLSMQRALGGFSLACREWAHAASEYAHELRGVPLQHVARALARFDRATSLCIYAVGAPASAIRSTLAAVPWEHVSRIQSLTFMLNGAEPITVDDLTEAFRPADGKDPSWGALRELALWDGKLEPSWDPYVPGTLRLAARLPALVDFTFCGMRPSLHAWHGDPLLFADLCTLEFTEVLESLIDEILEYMTEHHRSAPVYGNPPRLQHLVIADVKALKPSDPGYHDAGSSWWLNLEGLPALEELEVRRARRLYAIEGLDELSALTRLVLQDAPLATDDAALENEMMDEIAQLTQLRDLRLCRAPRGLHCMPSALSALTALTSLELGMRLRDRDGDGPEPEDLAPLGRGAPAALGTDPAALAAAGVEHGPLMCFGLRRLVVRGFRGPLHLPEGLERFTALEELDLGGRQTLANLGPWLLQMPALRRVVVPTRSAAQDVFEALELRSDPHQVDVFEDPDGPTFSDSDSDGILESFLHEDEHKDEDQDEDEHEFEDNEDEDDDDDDGEWTEDGEPWAGEGV